MNPRKGPRTQDCGRHEAGTRLASAQRFLDVAALVEAEDEGGFRSTAASLAVLAGIAASDAACCVRLGHRSRGERHEEASRLLEQIAPGGPEAATAFRRLIAVKDKAQYGIMFASREDVRGAMKQAQRLLDFADGIVKGRF